jgi:hypothetical protein
MLRGMEIKFVGVPMFIWGALCLLVAIVFAFIWPSNKATSATGVQFALIRWGHSLVWLLLATSCFVRGLHASASGPANIIALLAGLIYVAFLASVVTAK